MSRRPRRRQEEEADTIDPELISYMHALRLRCFANAYLAACRQGWFAMASSEDATQIDRSPVSSAKVDGSFDAEDAG